MFSEYIEDNLLIRRMIEDDVNSVKYLESVCGLSFWRIEDYRDCLKNESYIASVAQYSDQIVGFIIARLITIEKGDFNSNENANIAEIEIYNIAVDVRFRKKGIGKKLLHSCSKIQEKVSQVSFHLDVRKSNTEALGFYTRLGFVFRGIRKNFYNNPCEDSVYMSSEINYKH